MALASSSPNSTHEVHDGMHAFRVCCDICAQRRAGPDVQCVRCGVLQGVLTRECAQTAHSVVQASPDDGI